MGWIFYFGEESVVLTAVKLLNLAFYTRKDLCRPVHTHQKIKKPEAWDAGTSCNKACTQYGEKKRSEDESAEDKIDNWL